jgi:hypothetical protein
MKIKVSELSGVVLDWAVAKAAEVAVFVLDADNPDGKWQTQRAGYPHGPWWPSQDWSQGGPLISDLGKRIGLELRISENSASFIQSGLRIGYTASNVLIAACRAIVAAKLGDEVDVPEDLAP